MNSTYTIYTVKVQPQNSQRPRINASGRRGYVHKAKNTTPLKPQTPFIPGTKLTGPGIKAMEKRRNMPPGLAEILFRVGKGTVDDPVVGWIVDPIKAKLSRQMQEQHVNVCRQVAMKNSFACILIRMGVHDEQYKYLANGRRSTILNEWTGQLENEVVPADPHLTVYMGSGPYSLHVQGHIFVTVDNDKINPKVKLMEYPGLQRQLIAQGHTAVAEEFWWTGGTELVVE